MCGKELFHFLEAKLPDPRSACENIRFPHLVRLAGEGVAGELPELLSNFLEVWFLHALLLKRLGEVGLEALGVELLSAASLVRQLSRLCVNLLRNLFEHGALVG